MKIQSKSSILYMFRNFWKLVYVTLPVAVLWAFFYNASAELQLFELLLNGKISMDNCADTIGQYVTVLRFGNNWWIALCAVVLLALSMSLMVVKIDRHMRAGVMPAFPIRKAFGIFPIMLAYIAICVAVTEIFMLMIVGIAYMCKMIGNATAIVSIVFALMFVARVLMTYVFVLTALSFPLKYSENYRFNRAMSYSARTMFPKKRLLLGLTFAFPLVRLAVLAVAYPLQSYHLDVVVYAVALTLLLTYLPCFAFKQYYDDVGGERRDLAQKIFHR